MKLVIQIPCFNEEENLRNVVRDLPAEIEGIDEIEVLIIDDGSSDNTVTLAKELGLTVVSHARNMGLAASFKTGLKTALNIGADIIVNTDGDNQYFGGDIPKLVSPIITKEADMVIGARDIANNKDFSPVKKLLQKFGSSVVKLISSADVVDAPSGFRAFSKDCAQRINIFDNFSYTMETIIQAKAKGFKIKSVPIKTNPKTRPSRLFKNSLHYILRSACTIVRMFAIYRPFRFFTLFALLFLSSGLAIGVRYLYFWLNNDGGGHIQSLLLSAILIIVGMLVQVIAIFADLISINRRLLEDIQSQINKN